MTVEIPARLNTLSRFSRQTMQDLAHARPPAAGDLSQPFAAYPLAQLAAAFALGILGALVFIVPFSLFLCLAAITTVLAFAALIKHQMTATIALTLAALFLGSSLASIEKNKVPANQLRSLLNEGTIAVGEPVELTGIFERDPEFARDRLYLSLQVERIRVRGIEKQVSGLVTLLAPISRKSALQEFDQLDLRYGARVRIMTMLERADDFRNPGVSSFTEYLDRKGYDATGLVKSPLLIERLENERVFLPLAWLYEWRRILQSEIDSRFSKETAGVLDAALLGNRYNLSRSASERFREGGTFHVLVISGLHITFLGGLIFVIVSRFTKNKAVQFLLSVTALWSYSIAVGAEPSVVRAALMFTFVLLAPLVSRHASALNALGGAALVLLVWRPSDLLDPSFQLTFVSVLAIVIFAWPALTKMSEVGSWRPGRETPYPPACQPWLRSFCEGLFWSERRAQRELERANYSYKLFKLPLAATLERVHLQRPLRYVFAALFVSVCVQMSLLPLLVVYFHRFSFASFLLNIAVSLMMAGVAITAVAGLAIAQISSTMAAPLIAMANGLNWLMVHSVDPFARLSVASIRLPEYTGWAAAVYGLYYLPLAILAVSLSRWTPLRLPGSEDRHQRRRTLRFLVNTLRSLRLDKNVNAKSVAKDAKIFPGARRITKLASFAQLLAVTLIVFHPWSARGPDGKLRVDFLDVGQGDSALVTFPDNTTLLIDGGGRPGPFKNSADENEGDNFQNETRSIGEAVVSEYLWWRGLDHIDYILATHADADHIDGLNDVARNFVVRTALVARTPSDDPGYSQFSETLSQKRIPILAIGAGDQMRFGNVTASVLWPMPSTNVNAHSRNNDSIVLRLRFGDRTLLLTGDIEMPAEKAMLEAGENLQADVVKVAHHGSKTSSTGAAVAATCPRFALISVGQTSIFGHPSPEVVERWKHSGAKVLTTGNSGMITFTTDGSNLDLETFVKGK